MPSNRTVRRSFYLLFAALVAAMMFAILCPAARAADSDCLGCHDQSILKMADEDKAGMVSPDPAGFAATGKKYNKDFGGLSLAIDMKKLKASVHGSLSCTDCHADAAAMPHQKTLKPVDCTACHDEEAKKYAASVHRQSVFKGDKLAALTAPKNVSSMCARCHGPKEAKHEPGSGRPDAATAYMGGIHYQALQAGTANAPTCASCHQSHDIKGRIDPASPIYMMNVAASCGKCHEEEANQYQASAHGKGVAKGDWGSPTCTDCHPAHHEISTKDPNSPNSHLRVSDEICASCHINEAYCKKFGMSSFAVTGFWESATRPRA